MNTLIFDIETNAITDWATLSDLEVVHCLSILDASNGEMTSYNSLNDDIGYGLDKLSKAETIVGHNIIGFDVPALRVLYNFKHPNLIDTLTLARCINPDVRNDDFKREGFDKTLIGSHSLKAWGTRINVLKSDYGETSDWSMWSQEMQDYCEQDVRVTLALYNWLLSKQPSEHMVKLEHEFAKEMRRQEYNGFPFDSAKATDLMEQLMLERCEIETDLQKVFPPNEEQTKSQWWENSNGDKFPTKKAMIESGYKPNQCFKGDYKTKSIPFNPNSRDQICERLMSQGWKPAAFEGKRPAINEGVLKEINTDASLKLLQFLTISKRLGQLLEGNQAWIKLTRDGKIHGGVNTNGAVSGRCTHQNPNVAQVPSVRSPYGGECRELFTAPQGKVLVGCDASGLELRCLAHYLYPWDNGSYAKTILEGDIHTANQKAAGLETRDQAKTFIYATLYGAGDSKIGSIVGGTSKDGKRLKSNFKKNLPAYSKLVNAVEAKVTSAGSLNGLDGRKLPCRSPHSALNLLLQSAGAVIMKQALVDFVYRATKEYKLHANVHDEVQFSCDEEDAEELGATFVESIKKAGETLNFKCPLDGEYKIGNNWKETH
jgi:DNA polymerase-1